MVCRETEQDKGVSIPEAAEAESGWLHCSLSFDMSHPMPHRRRLFNAYAQTGGIGRLTLGHHFDFASMYHCIYQILNCLAYRSLQKCAELR